MRKSRILLLAVAFFVPSRIFGDGLSNPMATEIEKFWTANEKFKANRLLSKWMNEEKKSPWPWVEAATLAYREKRFKKALSLLKTALGKSPQCAEAYYWRGRSYEAMDKPMDAANEYRAALIAQERYREAQEALTRVLAVLGSS